MTAAVASRARTGVRLTPRTVGDWHYTVSSNAALRRLGLGRRLTHPSDVTGEQAMDQRTCSLYGCDREHSARGMCHKHYYAWYRTGGKAAVKKHRTGCQVEGCEGKHRGLGYCEMHYLRVYKHGSPDVVKPHPAGEANNNWKGDDVGYFALHDRLGRLLGAAAEYPRHGDCGRPAAQWAYDHGDPDEREDPTGFYSVDPNHYMPLCASCHKRLDLARAGRLRRSLPDALVQVLLRARAHNSSVGGPDHQHRDTHAAPDRHPVHPGDLSPVVGVLVR